MPIYSTDKVMIIFRNEMGIPIGLGILDITSIFAISVVFLCGNLSQPIDR